jgi:Rrf2 family protein
MISQTAEYCLRAVVCLARAQGRAQTTSEIAEATQIPPGYLSKVLQSLSRAGMVTAQRGLNGGFVLARDPATLCMLEIVRVADPSHRVAVCPLGTHGKDLCPLHAQLDEAAAMAEKVLANCTVARLMNTSDQSKCCALNRETAEAGNTSNGDDSCSI